ncbi:death domain-containing protein CRADD, partial [Biomphalaria glabrata]
LTDVIMSRGRLKPNDYKCIQDNFIFLKKELEARHLIDFLFQHGVISLEEKEHIGIKENKDARNDLLLTLILNAGPGDAFNYFLLSLEDRYRHVLTKLKGHSYSVQQQFHQEKNVLLEKL